MTTVAKILWVAGITAAVVWGYRAAKKAIADFQFDVISYGRPTLSGTLLTVPLQIKFTNPTPLPISVDNLTADIYLEKNGMFVPAAKVNEVVSIAPGVSTQWTMPVVNLENIFGGDVLNTLIFIQQIFVNKKIRIRSDVKAIYKGITLPTQSFTNTIDL